jgi:hypothetical protein
VGTGFYAWISAVTAVIVAAIVTAVVMSANYDYRWKQQCATQNGVQMENLSGGRVCVRGPVEIVTIAARPF